MRTRASGILAISCLLSACGDAAEVAPSTSKPSGRYAGIGTYDTGRLWAEMEGSEASSEPKLARLQDDEHVIVVIDSHTGEVRQCGDYSGFCVTMTPWTGQGSRTEAPVRLRKHAADLAAEDEASAAEPE